MKKVVVVGGGFAGAYVARKLQHDFTVTLIDTKDYFEFTPSILRTIVEPDHFKKIEVQHTSYLTTATFIKGYVTEVNQHQVSIGTKKIPFDYLVLAMGSTYSTPIKEQNLVIASRGEELKEYSQRLQKAHDVLIIGGGVVGVELAAEIITHFPKKKVTIVHAKDKLLERNHQRARDYAKLFFEKQGVHILWNERIITSKKGSYQTQSGKEIKADLSFLCTGIEPNYHCLNQTCSKMLNERKSVMVNNHLQVHGHHNIFAAGDITSIAEEKTAQNAEEQAKVVIKNIWALANSPLSNPVLTTYTSAPRPMIISLGKRDGILIYKERVCTGIIPAILKTIVEWKTMRKYR